MLTISNLRSEQMEVYFSFFLGGEETQQGGNYLQVNFQWYIGCNCEVRQSEECHNYHR